MKPTRSLFSIVAQHQSGTPTTPASVFAYSHRIGALAMGLGLAVAGSFSQSAQGAAITWDNGNTNQLWSDTVNWNPDGAAAGNDITFGATGVAALGTVTNIVDASVTINTLTFTNTGGSTSAHTTQINAGLKLTVSSSFNAGNSGVAGASGYVVITGATSTLAVGTGTGSSYNVGSVTNGSGSPIQTVDMSGLGTFTADVGSFNLGTGARNNGTVTLGATNTITATTISLGGNTGTGGSASFLNIGQTNTIAADTINVGNGRSGGTLQFRTTGLSNPTATITNRAGSGSATLNVGLLDNSSASGGTTGTVDFTGGTVTASFGTVTLGRGGNSSTGASTGNLLFGAGTLNASTINAGNGYTGSSGTGTGTANGAMTMSAGAGTLTATNVTLGRVGTAGGGASSSGTGSFTQNGGTAAITTLTLADRGATAVAANATGTYNLVGGTLKAQTIQAGSNGTGTGTATRTFAWTGGTIQNLNSTTDLTIASTNALALTVTGANSQSFTADANRTITVNAAITGTGGFSKDGAGILNLTGSNGYNGATAVNAGVFTLSGSGAINSSSGITINGSTAKFVQTSSVASTPSITLTQGTLDGTTTVGNVTVGAGTGGIVANGNGASNTALTLGSLNFTGAGAVSLRLAGGASTANAGLTVTNALTTSATVSVNLTPGSAWVNGNTYNLIGYGSFSGSNSNFALGGSTGLSGRQSGTFGNTGATNGFITLAVAGDLPVWTGLNGGQWTQYAVNSSTSGTPSFGLETGHTTTDFWTGDTVKFNDTYNLGAGNVAVTGTTVTIHGGNVSPTSVTFDNSAVNYLVTSDDASGIAVGSLTKNGSGNLSLNSPNSYTGGTTVNAGTVAINSASSLGASSGVATINSATLRTTANITDARGLALGASTSAISVDSGTTFTASGIIADGASAGTLNKAGAGTLTLSNANTYTGGTNFNNGPINIGNASALGTVGNLNFNGGTLQYGTGITTDLSARIATGTSASAVSVDTNGNNVSFATGLTASQSGGLTKLGSGTLTLSGTNSFTGGIALNAGTLSFGNSTATASNAITAADGTTISANSGIGSGALAGNVTVTGTNANVTVTNANASGGITLAFTGSADQKLTISNAGGQNVNANGSTKEFQNFLGTVDIPSGSGLVNRNSSTSWTNGGDSTLFNVNGAISSRNAGNWALGALSGAGTLSMGTSGSNNIGLTYTIGARNTDATFSGVIQDGDTANGKRIAIIKTGSAIQTLSGANTFTGTTTVNNGTLYANASNGANGRALSFTNGITVNNGGTLQSSANALFGWDGTQERTITVNAGGTLAANGGLTSDVGVGTVILNGGTMTTLAGGATDYGSFRFDDATDKLQVTDNSTISAVNVKFGSASAALEVATGKTANFTGTITDATAGGISYLNKTGAGTLTLTGTNTYTGSTTISGGTVALGSTGSINNTSGVSLGTSGTLDISAKTGGYAVNNLSGSGTVVGSLTVSTQLAIGNSAGTTTFDSLTLGASSTYLYELTGGASTADLGIVTGNLTITAGSVLDLVQLGSYTANDKFTLFGYTSGNLTGTFSGLADGAIFTDAGGDWQINYNDAIAGANGGTGTSFVTVTAVPEPAAALLGGLGLLALLRRRR